MIGFGWARRVNVSFVIIHIGYAEPSSALRRVGDDPVGIAEVNNEIYYLKGTLGHLSPSNLTDDTKHRFSVGRHQKQSAFKNHVCRHQYYSGKRRPYTEGGSYCLGHRTPNRDGYMMGVRSVRDDDTRIP